ncbi:MAG: ABC transporter permease [Vicinamibacterales bacterium]
MGRFLLRRLGFAFLLVFVVSSASLILTRLAPGDITTDQALETSAAERTKRRAELGLDQPISSQYISWLAGAVRFDFGRSLLYSRPVSNVLGERAVNTAFLAGAALLLATLIGLPLGIYTGSRPHGISRKLVRAISLVVFSLPPLIGSLGLILLAARTGWFPVGGMTSATGSDVALSVWLADLVRHLPVPALALALPLAATLERFQSQALAEAAGQRFVAASRARGVSDIRALLRHAWPVALRPVLGLYGVMIGSLFSGSFVVEVVTAWPGLGRLMFDALIARDLYLVAGCAAAGAAFLAVGTWLADALLAVADPRVRQEGRA